MTTTVVLVGRRPDNGRRDRLWAWCRPRWEELGWPVVAGLHGGGPYCMSVASNRAAEAAGDWDVAFYVGADWALEDISHAETAARWAERSGKLVFAHDETVVLSEQVTDHLLDGRAEMGDLRDYGDIGSVHSNTFSGALAVPRSLWDTIGGFDERFVGWGGEDIAFWCACWAIAGGFERVSGSRVYHLWHPSDRSLKEDAPEYPANDALMRRYLAARTDKRAMWRLLAEQ